MKNFVYLIFLFFLFLSCEKVENQPDQIQYESINKTISLSSCNSIRGACNDIIFSITEKSNHQKSAVLCIDTTTSICDAHNDILVSSNPENVHMILEGEAIGKEGNWTLIDSLCLDEFAGKGTLFLGHRIANFSTGEMVYYYDWIRIELSADKLTLKLIDRGLNNTPNNSIRAGQMQ